MSVVYGLWKCPLLGEEVHCHEPVYENNCCTLNLAGSQFSQLNSEYPIRQRGARSIANRIVLFRRFSCIFLHARVTKRSRHSPCDIELRLTPVIF